MGSKDHPWRPDQWATLQEERMGLKDHLQRLKWDPGQWEARKDQMDLECHPGEGPKKDQMDLECHPGEGPKDQLRKDPQNHPVHQGRMKALEQKVVHVSP